MPNNSQDYHLYSHANPSVETLGGFVGETDSIGIGLDIKKLLLYKDENGNSNLDKLINLYTPEEYNSNGNGKFNKIIDSIKNDSNNKEVVKESTSNGSVSVEDSETPTPQIYTPINESKLNSQLKVPRGTTSSSFLYYTPTPVNLSHINLLYNDDMKLLFKKFLYRVETETDYNISITSSYRSQEREKDLSKTNDLAVVGFNYHLARLAIDVNLSSPIGNTIINSKSDTKTWVDTKVPKIAQELGLRWGGSFKKVDVVHFDAKDYFTVNKQEFLKADGGTIPEEKSQNDQQESTPNNSKYFDLPIKIGTILALPLVEVDRQVLTTETNQTVNSVDFEGFLAKKIVNLLSDKGYKRTFTPKTRSKKGSVKEIFPFISVWVWSRSLSISELKPSSDGSTKYEHVILNITPYLYDVNTTVAENGGNFTFNLAPVTSDIGNDNNNTGKGWKIKDGTQKAGKSNKQSLVTQNNLHYVDGDQLKRNRLYFDKSLQANDVVFIRFERLELEDQRVNLDELETISINDLPNQTFDMIGLIDNVSVENQFDSLNVNVSVSGKDLVKLLIEDGVYFYPTDFTEDGIFSNTGATNSRLDRFGNKGGILDRFQSANRTIDRSLKYLVNNLGSIEICPGDLFNGYANTILDKDSSKTIDVRSRAYPFVNLSAKNEDQFEKNSEARDRIIEKIEGVRNINEITDGSSIKVFDTIKKFISERIDNSEIFSKNEKITIWETDENGIIYHSKVPSELNGIFILPDRAWLDNKDRDINKSLEKSTVSSEIESVYSKINKDEFNDLGLELLSSLSNKKSVKPYKNRYYYKSISVDEIINELENSDVINEFPVEISTIKTDYNLVKSKGDKINLKLVARVFKDLSSTEKDVFNEIYNLVVNEKSTVNKSNEGNPPLLAGIWQIIKLIIDDSVKDRRLTDSSIGNENGSLLNAIRKICQDPFCEFYTDTYGSQFYFIARKKPFDKESILSFKEGRVVSETQEYYTSGDSNETESDNIGSTKSIVDTKTVLQDLIIDIEEEDVISDSLTYSNEAYSWYKIQLANLTSGSSSDLAFNYLKAVYFDEFADVFGSRPLDVTTSYIPYSPVIDKNKEIPAAYFIRQGIYDLKYLIESHAYLPFTRMGTITINGDRRIKRGNFVRYKGTDEIFYVDSVSNSFTIGDDSIDRVTTLQVSRGMVERFISGVDFSLEVESGDSVRSNSDNGPSSIFQRKNPNVKTDTINISYFNICDLTIDESIFSKVNDKNKNFNFSKSPTAGWKVNKEVFNFFLKKLQFAKNDNEIVGAGINIFKK